MKGIVVSIFLTGILSASFAQDIPQIYQQVESSYLNSQFEAVVTMTSEIETFCANRADTLAANSLFYLGDAHNQLGAPDKAIGFWEREKVLRAKLNDPEYYSTTLYNLASVYLLSGKYARAGEVADELLVTDKKVYGEASPEFAASAINIADIYIQVDRFRDAEHVLNQTLRKQNRKTVRAGLILNKLGDLYTYTGQLSKAGKALQEAADILFLEAGEKSAEYTSAAIALGVLYISQGKYPEAEEIFDVALDVLPPDGPAYPAVLNNQALVYQSLGQLERAEQMLQKIRRLDSASIGTAHPDFAITLSNLGQLYTAAGKYPQAEKVLLQSLDILKGNKETNTVSYARKLNNLAKVYQLSGQPAKAIPYFQDAATAFKKLISENSPEYATAIFNLGNAYWKAGKGSTGLKHLKTSASIRAKVLGKKHPSYAESVQKIAEYQWEQKEFGDARQSFGEVFNNFYYQIDVTFPGLTEEEKSRFYYTNIRESFEKFNSFAVEFAAREPQLLGDAFNYHINTKGAIMYATEKVKKAILASNDSLLIGMFEKWHEQKEQIARSYSQNQDNSKIDSLVQAANALEKELTKKSAEFAGQFSRKKYTWQDVQKQLKSGEAAVEVIRFGVYEPTQGGKFTDKVTYAFLLVLPGAAAPELIAVPNGTDLEGKYFKYYHNSIQYQMDDKHSFKNFFQPLDDVLRARKISTCYFSPDGIYNQININSVLNTATGKYLLDEYDFRLVTNAKELVEQSEPLAASDPVLIGFPKFNMERTSSQAATDVKITRGGNLTRGMRGLLRFMRGNEGITELPGTQKEIQDISVLFNDKPQVYLATRASEDIAKQVSNPSYLHIATHGYFLEDEDPRETEGEYVTNPLLKAGLILAGAENFLVTGQPVNDAGDDGILTAYEAMNLRLDKTRLVVLSACETGLGKVKNGEGVYGLQRAFKLAGAQTIVMSLWSVDDDATQELMTSFYDELLKSGNQHEAFRIAQQKIKEKYGKPFYWGAFIMVGI